MSKKETKNTVKPHTEAKIKFYILYIERYLPILLKSIHVKKVNIYDMFCGAGIYDDGKQGSAIRAFDKIREIQANNNGNNTEITLTLNDLNEKKISAVKEYIKTHGQAVGTCFSNKDASDLIKSLIDGFNNKQNNNVRNLVFIDPYGYKIIEKELILGLLRNERTEVIVFLPISQMFRFRKKLEEDQTENYYIPLKNFIEQFAIDLSNIRTDIDLIGEIKGAFSFGKEYYSTSYHIKNEKGTHYALFFITKNIYGLEKILEVKWQLDSQQGKGFNNQPQHDLFLELDKLDILYNEMLSFLSTERDNVDMYEFILDSGFLPKHGNQVLKELLNNKKIIVESEKAKRGAFYINYENYKNKISKIRIKLNVP